MTQETRVARIGIYTDKMVLSVMEQDEEEGKSFVCTAKKHRRTFWENMVRLIRRNCCWKRAK